MGRRRNAENRALPARWRYKHGAYYYRVPPGLESHWDGRRDFRLGSTLAEAYQTWAERLNHSPDVRTIADLLDRYALEVIPQKGTRTQTVNQDALKRLRPVFGHMGLRDIEPWHVYHYVDRRDAKTVAQHEVQVLRHAFTKAVEWGLIRNNPLIGQLNFRGRRPQPRDRYIEDWEIIQALSLPSRRHNGSVLAVQAFIRLALLTGLRRSDLLTLRESHLCSDGIHVQPSKTSGSTGKSVIFAWEPHLREAVRMCQAARPVDVAPWLFCNRRGECYVDDNGRASGWDSIWQRFMKRVIAETEVERSFTQHDLRAKVGSDQESREHARDLLTHADVRTTERSYRRRPAVLQPSKQRF